MTQVIWAPQAVEDVGAIRAYVARDSAHHADLVLERIAAAVARLERDPLSGRVVPEVGDESLRERIQAAAESCAAWGAMSRKSSRSFTALDCFGSTEAAVRERLTSR